jgi:RNA-splicing ligase RtcB
MTPNYDYKYSDREYEVMSLKKQLKEQVKGGNGARGSLDDSQQEMNELLESEEEVNAADDELISLNDGLSSIEDEYEYDCVELSLVDSDEEREIMKKAKAKQAKINNSFTGPYPLDPTDFNHKDKGPNY